MSVKLVRWHQGVTMSVKLVRWHRSIACTGPSGTNG